MFMWEYQTQNGFFDKCIIAAVPNILCSTNVLMHAVHTCHTCMRFLFWWVYVQLVEGVHVFVPFVTWIDWTISELSPFVQRLSYLEGIIFQNSPCPSEAIFSHLPSISSYTTVTNFFNASSRHWALEEARVQRGKKTRLWFVIFKCICFQLLLQGILTAAEVSLPSTDTV